MTTFWDDAGLRFSLIAYTLIAYIKHASFYLLLNTECEPGLYGDDCDKWCFCKDMKPCDRRYGYCPEKECQKGWSLSSCDYRGKQE